VMKVQELNEIFLYFIDSAPIQFQRKLSFKNVTLLFFSFFLIIELFAKF
jgi:hypothetical protein